MLIAAVVAVPTAGVWREYGKEPANFLQCLLTILVPWGFTMSIS